MRSIHFFLLCIIVLPINTRAQEEARAAWQVTNVDITVNSPCAERALNARATVSVRNVGLGSGATLTLRLNSKAEVKSVTVGGSSAAYKSLPEARGGAQRITITLPSAVAANQTAAATVEYRLPVEENTGLAAISPTSHASASSDSRDSTKMSSRNCRTRSSNSSLSRRLRPATSPTSSS